MLESLCPAPPFEIGDTVWWGDLAYPEAGVIYNFSNDGNTAFVCLKKSAAIIRRYTYVRRCALRPVCPICGMWLNVGEPCKCWDNENVCSSTDAPPLSKQSEAVGA